jgi:heptosyltransferase III
MVAVLQRRPAFPRLMQRYSGESLGACPHIIVLGSCKVGNFVVSTPVLKGLALKFPDSVIGFLGSEITADLELAHPSIHWRASWDLQSPGAGLKLLQTIQLQIERNGPVALAINLDGFNPLTCALVPWLHPQFVAGGSLALNQRTFLPWGDLPQQKFLADPDWDSPAFLQRYSPAFASNYIAELFCQLAFVSDYVDPADVQIPQAEPAFVVPDLLIHCTTARAAKVWPAAHWLAVLQYSESLGIRVGLVGSPPKSQLQDYNAGDLESYLLRSTNLIDLRGQTSLIELAGACCKARAVISVDAGPLHIAAAVGTPTLAIVGNDAQSTGASPLRLWLPRCKSVTRTVSDVTCTVCAEHRFRNNECLVDGHPCMAGVSPQQAIDWLAQLFTQTDVASIAHPGV